MLHFFGGYHEEERVSYRGLDIAVRRPHHGVADAQRRDDLPLCSTCVLFVTEELRDVAMETNICEM